MATFLIRALQLIMSLSLLVIIHEGGHFLMAKLFKVRVEKFSIFFDPWFKLFSYKPRHSDTEYSIGWLPLGGYVKISGMIDESMDTDQMKHEPQEWEFRSKPAWQRLLIMVAGVVMNFFLALFIYSMILYNWGDNYVKLSDMDYGMKYNEMAHNIGFQDGDILISADGKSFERFGADMFRMIADAREVTVRRHSKDTTIYMPEVNLLQLAQEPPLFVDILIPNEVDSVLPGKGFYSAGIKKGDKLTSVDGRPVKSWNDFLDCMSGIRTDARLAGKRTAKFQLTYQREGRMDTTEVTTDSLFMVGAMAHIPRYMPQRIKYNLLESFPAGARLGMNTLRGYMNDMKYVFSSEGAKSLGGFGTLGAIFPPMWDWHRFWTMTAFLSLILAFMNILPIPALDGGHVLFLLYEVITRRKPGDRFMEYAQVTGMLLLFLLFIWANFNDLIRFVF